MATKRKSLKLQPRTARSMFPFHRSDELVWLSFPDLHQEDIIPQDLILDQRPSVVGANKIGKGLPHRILSTLKNGEANTSNDKKIVRRDTEQKRRLQMAILNESLRSLLPVEMIQVRNLSLSLSLASFSSFLHVI
jgi:hypothetical protein